MCAGKWVRTHFRPCVHVSVSVCAGGHLAAPAKPTEYDIKPPVTNIQREKWTVIKWARRGEESGGARHI